MDMDANEVINDLFEIIAGKEREITALKIQLIGLQRKTNNEEVKADGGNAVQTDIVE